jgi:hypothetical protein
MGAFAPDSFRAMALRINSVIEELKRTPDWLLLAGGMAIFFYCFMAIHFGKLPLRIEESDWPQMAEAVYRSGEPVIEADETHLVRFNQDLSVDQSPLIGASQPPLYAYTLAASMGLLGTDAANGLRVIGAIGLVAAIVLLFLIAREATTRWRLVGGVAAILLLVHPYAVQGSVFLDIDTSIYAPIVLLAIWVAIRRARRPGPLRPPDVLAIGGLLALATWAKLPTAIVLGVVLAAWWLLSRRPLRRAAAEAAAFLATAAALFLATYALWCEVTGIPFSYTFDANFGGESNFLSEWPLVGNAVHWHLRWFGAALLILGVIYAVDLVRSFLAERRLRPLDLCYLFGVGVLITYVVFSPTDGVEQGKYAFPALAALILPIAWMLLRNPLPEARSAIWVVVAVVGLATAFLLPDRLENLSAGGDYGSWGSELVAVLATGAALWLVWRLGGRRGFAGGVVVVVVGLLAVQTARSYESEYSPLYPIPDNYDFVWAVRDMEDMLGAKDIVVAPKDLAFYVEQRVIEGEDAFARGDARLAAAIRRYPKIKVFARGTAGPPVGPMTEALLDRCFPAFRGFNTTTMAYRNDGCP